MLRTLSFLQKQGLLAVLFVFSGFLVEAQEFPVKWGRALGFSMYDTAAGSVNMQVHKNKIWVSSKVNQGAVVSKLNLNGSLLWQKELSDLPDQKIFKLIPDPQSEDVWLVGGISDSEEYYGGFTGGMVKRMSAQGEVTQEHIVRRPDVDYISFTSGVITGAGAFLLGCSVGHNQFIPDSALLIKLSKNPFEEEWALGFPTGSIQMITDVIELSSGKYLVAGVRNINHYLRFGQTVLHLIDADGNIEWIRVLGRNGLVQESSPEANNSNQARGVALFEVRDTLYLTGNSAFGAPTNSWSMLSDSANAFLLRFYEDGSSDILKTIGGTKCEHIVGASVKKNGNIMLSGYTASSDGDIPYRISSGNYYHQTDMWLPELNGRGDVVRSVVIGGTNPSKGARVLELDEDDWVVAGLTYADDRHFAGSGVLQHPNYWPPVWVGRIFPRTKLAFQGFQDTNENGNKEEDEPYLNNYKVIVKQEADTLYTLIANSLGAVYSMPAPGAYDMFFQSTSPYFTPLLTNAQFNIGITVPTTDTFYVPFRKLNNVGDIQVATMASGVARPGFDYIMQVTIKNIGTTTFGDSLKLVMDSRVSGITTNAPGAFLIQDTLTIPFEALEMQESASFDINMRLSAPPQLNFGDTIKFKAQVFPITNDVTPSNNQFTLKQLVTGSYDPNDKTESHAGVLTQEEIDGGEYLNYLIRFQNTGTDTAFTVVIRDTLEARLDVSSFEMIAASHDYNLSILNGNQLAWTFNNINLADSNVNEPASHGYVQFRIRPFPTLAPGDTIKNSASIYFDYNLPVLTNTEKTTLVIPGTLPVKLLNFSSVRKGSRNEIVWQTAEEQQVERFTIERSLNRLDYVAIGSAKAKGIPASYAFSETAPVVPIVYYRLKVVDTDGSIQYSPVVALRGNSAFSATVFPNPITGDASIELNSASSHVLQWSIRDMEGRLRKTGTLQLNTGTSIRSLPTAALEPGMFIISLKGKDAEQNIMIIKK